ncbi:MAG: GNAT family N-acetyltransferase [Flavobacteriales bacterium]|nr:GNAT family N-acetyltransferase [Flavobacteriales bacterium]
MLIRPATTADIPTIRSIAHAAWPVAYANILSPAQLDYMLELMYSEAALLDQFTIHGHRFQLAERNGTAIGFASHESDPSGTSRTRLHKLYVLPERQGTGTGKALLHAVEQRAAEVGDAFVEFNVNKYNPALAFYQRQGYTILRSEVNDIGRGFVMDDHVMEKALRP